MKKLNGGNNKQVTDPLAPTVTAPRNDDSTCCAVLVSDVTVAQLTRRSLEIVLMGASYWMERSSSVLAAFGPSSKLVKMSGLII